MSKKAKKILKKIDPLMGGDKILDKLGLPSVFGDKYGIGGPGDAAEASATGSVEAPPPSVSVVSDETQEAREAQRKRQLAAAGLGGNILTGAGGLGGAATTSGKSLLGS